MHMRSVHSREIEATPASLGRLLDGLGGEDDRLWPSDRWPTMAMVLDRPVGVGAAGGHGSIRYAVEEHVRGERVVFRFAPGVGLVGTHRFDVERVGSGRSQLTHTLDARVQAKLVPVARLVRRYHDAMMEDLLDRAERETTGRLAPPSRRPVWLRAANALDVAIARRQGTLPTRAPRASGAGGALAGRLTQLAGVAVPSVLATLAGLHAAWALGWTWPGGSEHALAERVVGADELPPESAVWGMAAVLLAAAGLVASAARGARARTVRIAAWGVAAGLLVRGVVLLPSDLLGGLDTPFERLDLAVYSPLCLALGAGAATVLWRTGGARTSAAAARPAVAS